MMISEDNMENSDILWPLIEPQDRRQYFTDLLVANDCEVTFTKVDGSVRIMNCTLRPDALPARDDKSLNESRETNAEVIKVYDLAQSAWRSFRVANVTNITVKSQETT
jgi:hypothetical protein